MRRRSRLPVIATLAGAAALSGLGATYAVEALERHSAREVEHAFETAGIDWAEVRTDGLAVHLAGTAPDEATRFRATNLAGSVIDGDRIVDEMTVADRAAMIPPDFSIEILRREDALAMIGLVPEDVDREALAARVSRAGGDLAVTDLLETAVWPAPEGWDETVAFGLTALERLDRAKVSITPGEVTVNAMAQDAEARARAERDLGRLKPEAVALSLDLTAPRPVITPFTLRIVREDGVARFDACSASSEEDAAAIVDAAREAGLDEAEARTCDLGLGVPSADWTEAATAAIDTLAEFDTATLTVSDLVVTLEGGDGTDADGFESAMARLGEALPPEFTVKSVLVEALPDPEEAEAAPFEFRATRDDERRVTLSGQLPSERAISATDSFARALFGSDNVVVSVDVRDAMPGGWSPRILASLDALSLLDAGTVTVHQDMTEITGRTGVEGANAEISRILSAPATTAADASPRFEIAVSYDERLSNEQEPLTPQDCVDQINGVLAARQITFASGSATIDTESRASVDAIAEIVRQCEGVPMEIAGFTDSQGSDEMNRQLSDDRAEALLVALMARRVLTSDLEATGYGEENPIADNSTAEGREANRRIEFSLLGEEDEDEDEGDDADSSDQQASDETQ